MKKYMARYGGIFFGAAYGMAMRLLFGLKLNFKGLSFTDLFSINFVVVVPILIGMAPILFANDKQLKSVLYTGLTPWVSVMVFFLACFWSGKEDIICILILTLPFMIAAMVGGLIMGLLLRRYRQRRGAMYSVLLLPLVCGLAEEQYPTPTRQYCVGNSVIINAPADSIWKEIVRVRPISDAEYNKGFFGYAGIPRPLYAELDRDTVGAIRTGHFEGGLQFRERVIKWKKNKTVAFDIAVIPGSVRHAIFDEHILKGGHFQFINATYTLSPADNNRTLLHLSTTYELTTNINGYGTYWANALLSDFQSRLLTVIAHRCAP